jgi:hypothetical protein
MVQQMAVEPSIDVAMYSGLRKGTNEELVWLVLRQK